MFLVLVLLLSNCSKKSTATNMEFCSNITIGRISSLTCNQFDEVYHSYMNVNTLSHTVSFSNRTLGECSNIESRIGDSVYLLNDYTAENNTDYTLEKFKLSKGVMNFYYVFILQNDKRTIRIHTSTKYCYDAIYPDSIKLMFDLNNL